MKYIQPNLPAYNKYKRKPADFASVATSTAAAISGAIAAAGATKKKAEAERKKLEVEADKMEMNFVDLYNQQEKSNIVQMDAANRKIVEETASELNGYYMDAYGSGGTKEARALYKQKKAEANEMLQEIGEFATIQSMNQKALSSNANSSKNGYTEGLMTDDTLYGSLADQYAFSSRFKSGAAQEYEVYRDGGHTKIRYKVLNPDYVAPPAVGTPDNRTDEQKNKYVQDQNGDKYYDGDVTTAVADFKNTGKTLGSSTIGKDDLLSTSGEMFKKNYIAKNLIPKGIQKITQTYDPVSKKHVKTKVIDNQAFEDLLTDPVNGDKINSALEADMKVSNFGKKFYQLGNMDDASGNLMYNTDGVGNTLPLADMPWGFSNKMSDKQFEEFNTNIVKITHGGANATSQSAPTHFKGGPLGNQEIADPTPGDGKLTRQDLMTIQQMSGKQMLVNYYATQSPEGEQELSRTDRFDYEKTSDGKYTTGTKTYFSKKKPSFDAVNSTFNSDVWTDPADHTKGIKVSNDKQYVDLLNKIATVEAGASSSPKITYMQGSDVNSQLNPATPFDDNQIYKITMGNNGVINKVNVSQFSNKDWQSDPEDMYQQIMAGYQVDGEMQDYFNGKIQ